jgi:hypothetical protein
MAASERAGRSLATPPITVTLCRGWVSATHSWARSCSLTQLQSLHRVRILMHRSRRIRQHFAKERAQCSIHFKGRSSQRSGPNNAALRQNRAIFRGYDPLYGFSCRYCRIQKMLGTLNVARAAGPYLVSSRKVLWGSKVHLATRRVCRLRVTNVILAVLGDVGYPPNCDRTVGIAPCRRHSVCVGSAYLRLSVAWAD